MEEVVLVTTEDEAIGTMGKTEVHQRGILHRAFSVFLFNDNNELLLQQRALDKYHSGGLWTNTCCSHPRPNENTIDAANRRLQEEMGLSSDLTYLFNFVYYAALDNDLIEHELDHVFTGRVNGNPSINPEEVHSFKFMSLDDIEEDMKINPDQYTAWFKIVFDRFRSAVDLIN